MAETRGDSAVRAFRRQSSAPGRHPRPRPEGRRVPVRVHRAVHARVDSTDAGRADGAVRNGRRVLAERARGSVTLSRRRRLVSQRVD